MNDIPNNNYRFFFWLKIWDLNKQNYLILSRYHDLNFIPQIGMKLDFEKEPMFMNLVVEDISWSNLTGLFSITLSEQHYKHDDWDRIIEHYKDVRRNMTYVPRQVMFHTRWKIESGVPKM